jgi:hypothetical protein
MAKRTVKGDMGSKCENHEWNAYKEEVVWVKPGVKISILQWMGRGRE